ncbi:prephenate dehydratase [Candidatus Micrarchaeota archaeon]|nr:prephenate dehydratase [Candidatus Micrarchaeota archaeon]
MELEDLRKKIDRIDSEIIQLLSDRMEIAVRTKHLKKTVSDPDREKELLSKIISRSRGLLSPAFSEKLYKEILLESKSLQQQDLRLVGFQGEHGAYSEVAALSYDKNLVPIPCDAFDEVFKAVSNGQLDLAILPVENSIAGPVTQVCDLLMESDLKIIAEIKQPIHHCLLALPDSDYREIKVVYSHPQALAQCKGFISRNTLESRQFYDTAGSAMMIAKDRPAGAAAIASSLCAELYGLEVLKENIEDHNSNTTRFLVLSKDASVSSKTEGNKCTVVFSTAHKTGALFEILKLFYESKINLTKIESRPVTKDPGKFAFLVDFQGSDRNPIVQTLLKSIQKETTMFRFLGCYKEAV